MKKLYSIVISIFLLLLLSCQTVNSIENFEANNIVQEQKQEHSLTITQIEEDNSHILFGNPTNATIDSTNIENLMLRKNGYILSYNNKTLTANWCSWHLDKNDMGDTARKDLFKPDLSLPENWNIVGNFGLSTMDYQFKIYGFDRGHLCPSADRTATSSANEETFFMTNMIPQAPNNNQRTWKNLEDYERSLVDEGNEVYIIAGPYGIGGISTKGYFDYIILDETQDIKIKVPSQVWKIILCISNGDNDLQRVSQENTKIIAVMIPNNQSCNKNWKNYIVTVDYIEQLTGWDFLAYLPDDIEAILESQKYSE